MKKIIALACAAILAVGSISVAANTAEVGVLSGYGVMRGDPDGNFRIDSSLTRAEAVCMIFRMTGIAAQESDAIAPELADLEGHWAYNEIVHARINGLIDGDAEFKPDEYISFAELAQMLVSLLGYTPQAESMGGAPHGYIAVGSRLGLFENLTTEAHSTITRGDAAVMLCNGLDVPLMKQIGFGGEVSYAVMDGTGVYEYQTLRTSLEQ